MEFVKIAATKAAVLLIATAAICAAALMASVTCQMIYNMAK